MDNKLSLFPHALFRHQDLFHKLQQSFRCHVLIVQPDSIQIQQRCCIYLLSVSVFKCYSRFLIEIEVLEQLIYSVIFLLYYTFDILNEFIHNLLLCFVPSRIIIVHFLKLFLNKLEILFGIV